MVQYVGASPIDNSLKHKIVTEYLNLSRSELLFMQDEIHDKYLENPEDERTTNEFIFKMRHIEFALKHVHHETAKEDHSSANESTEGMLEKIVSGGIQHAKHDLSQAVY